MTVSANTDISVITGPSKLHVPQIRHPSAAPSGAEQSGCQAPDYRCSRISPASDFLFPQLNVCQESMFAQNRCFNLFTLLT